MLPAGEIVGDSWPDSGSHAICDSLFYALVTDSHQSPDLRESFQGSRAELFFCEARFGALQIANRRFETIHATRSYVTV